MILAGDVGGTKTRLALFEPSDGRLTSVAEATFPSRDHDSLEEIVQKFLDDQKVCADKACFGVAGPVRHGVASLTNLKWRVDTASLSKNLCVEHVHVINDLEATAYATKVLDEADIVPLQPGAKNAEGNQAVIAAGTGLGEAGLFWDGEVLHPFASEGGHGDFAPQCDAEVDLLLDIKTKYGHAGWERVLSGPGLVNVYESILKHSSEPEVLEVAEEISTGDPAAAIAEAALDGRSAICMAALEMFVSLYGAEAGNLALKMMATGGVYIGGGIAPRIRAKMEDGTFVNAFNDKGRLSSLMRDIPVKLILNDKAALLGAAHRARLNGNH